MTAILPPKARALHGRFAVEPHFRKPNRYAVANKTGLVRDGYTFTDTVTGVIRRVDSLKDAKGQAMTTLRRESEIDWNVVVGWRADFDRAAPGIGWVEVSGVDAAGKRVESIAMVQKPARLTSDEGDAVSTARQLVLDWLAVVGHPELPQVA